MKHSELLTCREEMIIQARLIREHYPYAYNNSTYIVNAMVKIKRHGDLKEYIKKYEESLERISSQMEEDEEFKNEMESAQKRYEAERREAIERWRAKNIEKVMANELKRIEAGE